MSCTYFCNNLYTCNHRNLYGWYGHGCASFFYAQCMCHMHTYIRQIPLLNSPVLDLFTLGLPQLAPQGCYGLGTLIWLPEWGNWKSREQETGTGTGICTKLREETTAKIFLLTNSSRDDSATTLTAILFTN